MNIKEKAYQLFKSGCSYGEIADELFIGKSTAHNYVKEVKLLNSENPSIPVQNSSGKGLNVRSKQKTNEQRVDNYSESKKTKQNNIKEFTGDDLLKKQFISYDFTGKFLELIGKPSKPFAGIIWGLPKGGKSNLSIRFADYLSEYFGSVCYIAAEEGESVTLQMKIRDIGGSKVTFVELKDKEKIREYLKNKNYVFVFIDSINNAEIDHEFLELIKSDNPKTSFIGIVQATKSGNFKGDQALTHNCDFIIKVIAGIAYHEGRFNNSSEIAIFTEPLYEKNPFKNLPILPELEVKVKPEPIDILAGSIEKVEIAPARTLDLAKLLQSLQKQKAPETITKKPVQPPVPMDKSTAKWYLGTIAVIAVLDGLSRVKKKDQK